MLRMLIILGLCFSSLVSAETLVPAKLEDQSPKETLRKSIFGTQEKNRGCRILSRDPAATVDQDAALSATLKSIIKSIKEIKISCCLIFSSSPGFSKVCNFII